MAKVGGSNQPTLADRKHAGPAGSPQGSASSQGVEAIVAALDAIVYVADMDTHELLYVNGEVERLFGPIVGQTCWQALQVDQNGPCGFCTNSRLVGSNGEPAPAYVWEFQNTLNGRWYQCRDRAIPWIDGRLVRLEIAADITERKQAEEALKRSAEALEQSNRLKALFIDIMSHDLLGQVAAAFGMSKLARLETDAEKRISLQDAVSQGLDRVAETIKSASLLATLEEGAELSRECDHFDDMVREVAVGFAQDAEARGMRIVTEIKSHGSVSVNELMRDVLQNLVANAVKYGAPGTDIEITVEPAGAGMRITVANDGEPIPVSDRELVFERFRRVSKQGVKGTGLGLAIVKHVVLAHGGRVWVDEDDRGWTRFLIELS